MNTNGCRFVVGPILAWRIETRYGHYTAGGFASIFMGLMDFNGMVYLWLVFKSLEKIVSHSRFEPFTTNKFHSIGHKLFVCWRYKILIYYRWNINIAYTLNDFNVRILVNNNSNNAMNIFRSFEKYIFQ